MKILFVLNQLPFPPRNGVTVPTYNYLRCLSRECELSLLLVRDADVDVSSAMLRENRALVSNLWVTSAVKQRRSTRIRNELLGRSIYHMGRTYDRSQLAGIIGAQEFDVVWVSDDAIVDIVDALKPYLPARAICILGLNDASTAVFKQARRYVFLPRLRASERFLLLLKWLRGFRIGPIENRYLHGFNLILVQTAMDAQYLTAISHGALDERVMVLPNAVAETLLRNPLAPAGQDVLFVGSLRGYSKILCWLLDSVWPTVRKEHPQARFRITGRGATPALLSKVRATDGVDITDYEPDLTRVYAGKALSVAPVLKGYGLINKVVESMAAGVPVVADRGSFNGIAGFADGVHGVVADDAQAMTAAIVHLLDDRAERLRIASAARALVAGQFRWEDRCRRVNERLAAMRDQPPERQHGDATAAGREGAL